MPEYLPAPAAVPCPGSSPPNPLPPPPPCPCLAAEGNLHGILVGRETLPDGVLYASRETHYSVFKVRMCGGGGGEGGRGRTTLF